MVKNSRFIDLIAKGGVITPENARRLLNRFHDNAFAVLMHLVRLHPHRKTDLGRLWGDSIGVAYVDPNKSLFQRSIVQLLPEDYARRNHFILLYQFGEAVTAATVDPGSRQVLDEAAKIIGRPISPVFSFPDDIEAAIEIEYKSEDQLRALSSKIVTDSVVIEDISELTRDELQKIAGTQAVVEFVQGLLLLGVREGRSEERRAGKECRSRWSPHH